MEPARISWLPGSVTQAIERRMRGGEEYWRHGVCLRDVFVIFFQLSRLRLRPEKDEIWQFKCPNMQMLYLLLYFPLLKTSYFGPFFSPCTRVRIFCENVPGPASGSTSAAGAAPSGRSATSESGTSAGSRPPAASWATSSTWTWTLWRRSASTTKSAGNPRKKNWTRGGRRAERRSLQLLSVYSWLCKTHEVITYFLLK